MNKINLHRYVWLELYGYLLHLLIPLQGLDLKIADVESGTGIVLTDFSRRLLPSVQLDSFDISSKDDHPQEWFIPNMNLIH
ncbi:hypothetical protein BDV32DRAFT_146132 [Aspergillus pseudonomiae]|uniref:Uncharacterized protein n=1 Tax=Aspergillus pseudonomiae TaxID=1506151 RepID=A0A5N7DFC7_9EURO|nr:uncharacterized protein BDV37DRAFT_282086 [Aspergillus pseudonomiae]KAB8263828.1 hypothetical protein BDV32DRAFT_146132 [Aspergillus pseudonomiae]KAE8405132.1 hypothetical protein BDV37DRAFT_282086 [Aspergillus pseudonomiae]